MSYKYRTIVRSGSGMFKSKGSKHIGYARHAGNEHEAIELVEHLRKEHHSAQHVCYAWRLEPDGETYRANDDGEPNNSAGMPILGQIDKFELTYTAVAVVRYFGGVKLGVGGLIEAYRTAAGMAIEDAVTAEQQLMARFRLHFGYNRMSEVMLAVRVHGWEDSEQDFMESCRLKISVLPQNRGEVAEAFRAFDDIRIENLGIN